MAFGLIQHRQIKALPVHEAMGSVSQVIWETCKTYLKQRGKFLALVRPLAGLCIIYYFTVLQERTAPEVITILLFSDFSILEGISAQPGSIVLP